MGIRILRRNLPSNIVNLIVETNIAMHLPVVAGAIAINSGCVPTEEFKPKFVGKHPDPFLHSVG